MTISYSADVANGSAFGCFWKILRKWKGSVYKLIWRELLFYLCIYYAINFTYRFVLDDAQRKTFEKIRIYFSQQSESIPMSFVLGFYVSLIVKRWWEQYRLLPWPDSLALFVSAAVQGQDERGRLMRRNIVRYAMLSYVITLQKVSFRVKKRFPTWQHMVDAGLMMESEKKIFEMMDEKSDMSKYWMPLIWATNIINRARKESLIQSDHVVQTILVELSDIRKRLGSLIGYDTVCVPLVYTQVVTLSVYAYFIAAIVTKQTMLEDALGIDAPTYEDVYFPFFLTFQFAFYIGWLKVAEVLINPFGEDDDDIELNWLIDRHVKAAYMIVDEMHEEHPELLKDQYWEEVVPKDLPYTVASEHYRRSEPKGSAEHFKVKPSESVYANIVNTKKVIADDMYADYESVDTPMFERKRSRNWFQKHWSRVGSTRSTNTTYSTGFFGRPRQHSSVYANPEAGMMPQNQHKMSLYERIVGRKSGRGQHSKCSIRQGPKMNGSAVLAVKNRPRIPTPDVAAPTPDVTKEVVDREQRLATLSGSLLHSQHSHNAPVVQVVLSPIQETETSILNGSQTGTATLAQTVLPPALKAAGIAQVTFSGTPVLAATPVNVAAMTLTPVTVTPLGVSTILTSSLPPSPSPVRHESVAPASLTELTLSSEEYSSSSSEDRSRKTSTASQTKRNEVYV